MDDYEGVLEIMGDNDTLILPTLLLISHGFQKYGPYASVGRRVAFILERPEPYRVAFILQKICSLQQAGDANHLALSVS